MWKSVGNEKKAADAFVATRTFIRRLATYAADLPKGVKYEPRLHGCPTPPGNIDFKYILSDEEGETLYLVKIECMRKESGLPSQCGQERIPPAVVAAARPAPPQLTPDAALAQLVPPATPAGQTFNPATAPKVPSDVSFAYLVDDDEAKLLYRIKLTQ